MTDDFALFGLPRRPWLDPEDLRQRFLKLSAEAHPDRCHAAGEPEKREAQDRSTRINAAFTRLREPKDRLRLFLELTRGERPSELQRVPPALMDLFFRVGSLCQAADRFLAEKEAATSPLLQVALFERGHQVSEDLGALRQVVDAGQASLLEELKTLDAQWAAAETGGPGSEALLDRLEELYRLFSYYGRWSAQLGERFVRCAF